MEAQKDAQNEAQKEARPSARKPIEQTPRQAAMQMLQNGDVVEAMDPVTTKWSPATIRAIAKNGLVEVRYVPLHMPLHCQLLLLDNASCPQSGQALKTKRGIAK